MQILVVSPARFFSLVEYLLCSRFLLSDVVVVFLAAVGGVVGAVVAGVDVVFVVVVVGAVVDVVGVGDIVAVADPAAAFVGDAGVVNVSGFVNYVYGQSF